jgi:hypothetical protein
MNVGRWLAIAALIASSIGSAAWGAERSPAAGANDWTPLVLPPNSFDINAFGYDKLPAGVPQTDNHFAPAPKTPSDKKAGIGLDVKTDYEVDLEKLLPEDKSLQTLQRGLLARGNTQRKTVPFMGLSVSKPLN